MSRPSLSLAPTVPAALTLAALTLAAVGCHYMKLPGMPRRGVAPDAGRDTAAADAPEPADTAAGPGAGRRAVPRDTALPAGRPSAAELEEKGPTYTPYEVGPRLLPGDWLGDLLGDTLAPVVDRHDELSVREFALFWVLVDRDGEVRDAVLHTTSGSAPFDRAARAVAERLRYRPAIAEGAAIPVWILARISLLMR